MGDVVNERREWWTDELIDRVADVLPPWDDDITDAKVYAVIAAVEDEQRKRLRSDGSQCGIYQQPMCECCYDVVQVEDHNVALEAQVKELLDLVKNQDEVEQGLRAQIQAVREIPEKEMDLPLPDALAHLGWNACLEAVIDALDGSSSVTEQEIQGWEVMDGGDTDE